MLKKIIPYVTVENITLLVAVISLLIAVNSWFKGRHKLQIVPLAIINCNSGYFLKIEVQNLSTTPLSIRALSIVDNSATFECERNFYDFTEEVAFHFSNMPNDTYHTAQFPLYLNGLQSSSFWLRVIPNSQYALLNPNELEIIVTTPKKTFRKSISLKDIPNSRSRS